MYDETKHILLLGSAIVIVKFRLRQLLEMSAFCPHTLEDAYATRQLHLQ